MADHGKNELVTEIGSALEYLVDRGEFDPRLRKVVTKTRYTPTIVSHVDVIWEGKKYRISCKRV